MASLCPNSSPGAIRPLRADSAKVADEGSLDFSGARSRLLRQFLFQGRPARIRFPQTGLRIGRKSLAVFLKPKQIEPLTGDQPKSGVTRHGNAARQVDGVIAAKLWRVNFRMGFEGDQVALITKTPNRPGLGSLELWNARHWTGVDEIGDRVKTLDGKTSVAVHYHPLGGSSLSRQRQKRRDTKAGQQPEKGYSRAKKRSTSCTVYFLPLCRHS
jgi:hypothetical protein